MRATIDKEFEVEEVPEEFLPGAEVDEDETAAGGQSEKPELEKRIRKCLLTSPKAMLRLPMTQCALTFTK